MSGAKLRFDPAASREVEAESFLRELEHGLALVRETPRVWRLFEAGTRRYIFRKFPYSLIYRELGDDLIEVVAVAHDKRRPGYWHAR